MNVKLEGGPYDQKARNIEHNNTQKIRLSRPIDNGGYTNRWYIYRKTTKQDENALPIFVFYWATDEDDDDGPSLES
jgi:hypothetical protein